MWRWRGWGSSCAALSCERGGGSRPREGRVPRPWHPGGRDRQAEPHWVTVMVTSAGTATPRAPPSPPHYHHPPLFQEVPDLWGWWEWPRGSGWVGESAAKPAVIPHGTREKKPQVEIFGTPWHLPAAATDVSASRKRKKRK